MVRLFIEDYEIELNSDVLLAITRQFEELENPTIIINDWSRTVEIPFTQNNDYAFGCIYNPDKIFVDGEYNIGVNFNPTKKLNFRLDWDGSTLMNGYAKMVEIKRSNGSGVYCITLNGSLGRVLQDMKNITFDKQEYATGTEEYSKYYIDGSQYFTAEMNKDLVYSSWTSNGQISSALTTNTSPINVIGFVPNNSYNNDFDYKTYQYRGDSGFNLTKTFEDTLGDGFKTDTGIEPSVVIGDGLYPREIGEYRSYLQQPFIYFNKLFQMFQQKVEGSLGYTFELDSEWFKTGNPYWYDAAYMLKLRDYSYTPIVQQNEYNLSPGYSGETGMGPINDGGTYIWYDAYEEVYPMSAVTGGCVTYGTDGNYQINKEYDTYGITFSTDVYFSIKYYTAQYDDGWQFDKYQGLILYFYIVSPDRTTVLQEPISKSIIVADNCAFDTSNYANVIKLGRVDGEYNGYDNIKVPVSFYLQNSNVYANNPEGKFKFYITAEWYNKSQYGRTIRDVTHTDTGVAAPIKGAFKSIAATKIGGLGGVRSFSKFIVNDLWNNEYNLLDEIIRYCKMFRIYISVDEFNKKVKFTQAKQFFNQSTVEDWTDKLDLTKDFIINPLPIKNKYVLFNYNDDDNALSKNYNEEFGYNFGELRLNTNYDFNTDTTPLFENCVQPVVNTDNVMSWSNIYGNHNVIYSVPAETYVFCKDDDGKYVNRFGALFFRTGRVAFDTTPQLNLRNVNITDDTLLQQYTGKYFYNQIAGDTTYSKQCLYYPKLDILKENPHNKRYLFTFNTPLKNYCYTGAEGYLYGAKNIYTLFWKEFLNERYDIQNKVVTCFLKITPQDYMNFKFNKFLMIENQLYFVNKIFDYDVTSKEPTKLELITVQNMDNYKSNYNFGN